MPTLSIENLSVEGTVIHSGDMVWVLDTKGYIYTTDLKAATKCGFREGDLAIVYYEQNVQSKAQKILGIVPRQIEEINHGENQAS